MIVALAALPALAPAARAADAPAKNLISNGNFAQGLDGWLYQQWEHKPAPGAVDKQTKHDGAPASFRMGLPGTSGDRYIGQAVAINGNGPGYVLSLAIKCKGVPANAAHVRLGIEGHGWLGTETGQSDIIKTGGTHDWKTFAVPVPASAIGTATKATLFIYDDEIGQGSVWIDNVSLVTATAGALTAAESAAGGGGPRLTGDTSDPKFSTFAIGQDAKLTFNAAGLKPDARDLTLDLRIVDEHDNLIATNTVPVTPDHAGTWHTTVDAPHDKLGFYRVHAKLSDGTELASLGTRPDGFLTYCVVPDPAKRVDYGPDRDLFGLQGAGNPDLCSLLGVHWVLDDSLKWRRMEPKHAGEFGAKQIEEYAKGNWPPAKGYQLYTLPTLYEAPEWACVPGTLAYETGTLTPDGEKAWAAYCANAAKAYSEKHPDWPQHVYQITWEPIPAWGFKGTDKDLIRIYQIAYPALHKADPKAVVAGPCRGFFGNGDPDASIRLFHEGLYKYIDAFIAHPYYSITPEKDGMPQAIRKVKDVLRALSGHDVPMYGSEQGWTTNEDISKEITQAQGLLRQNLITLGEGFRFNFGFYLYDYRLSGQKGYGYYYNLVPSVPFGPDKMDPKPIAPAYAAQSFLLEGSHSVGAIQWLGGTSWGYAFQRDHDVILALWDYGTHPRTVTIPTGAAEVKVYDWMGNAKTVAAPKGTIALQLGPEPVYVTGVSENLWGAKASQILVVDDNTVQAYPGSQVTIAGRATMTANQPFQATVALEADKDSGLTGQSKTITLGRNAPTTFDFAVNVPPTAAPGSRTLQVRLSDESGKLITVTSVQVNVEASLAVRVTPAFTADGKPALAVTLDERQGRAATGQLALQLKQLIPGAKRGDETAIDLVMDPAKTRDVPNGNKQVAFSVAGHGTQHILVPLPDVTVTPAKPYQVLVNVTTSQGAKFSDAQDLAFVGAARLDRTPAIDGNLADWPSGPTVTLQAPADVIRNSKAAPADLNAQLRYAWDDQNLYVAIQVHDDRFIQQNTGIETWHQDCVQLAFNTAPHAAAPQQSEIDIALTKNGPEAFRSLSSAVEKLPMGQLSATEFHAAIVKSDGGNLTYEIAIPWSTLGAAPGQLKPGADLGIAATVNEVRDEQQNDPCALGLFGGIYPGKDTNQNGLLVLQQ